MPLCVCSNIPIPGLLKVRPGTDVKTAILLAMLIASAAVAQPMSVLRSDAVVREQVKAERAHALHKALHIRLASLRH